MAESEAQAGNYDNMVKMVEDLSKDLEKLLEEIEKLTVQATWMAYDMVVMRTNPHLSNSMRRLEDAFLSCKEEMEKKWQEVLSEYKVFLFSSHRSFTDTVEDGFAFIILRTTYLYICGSILMRLHITYIFMLKVLRIWITGIQTQVVRLQHSELMCILKKGMIYSLLKTFVMDKNLSIV
nr:synaptonemal complex central element protein 3 isoform X2 [Columba livia]